MAQLALQYSALNHCATREAKPIILTLFIIIIIFPTHPKPMSLQVLSSD